MLKELRVKVLKSVFKRIRLGTRDGTFDNIGLDICRGKLRKQEVNRIPETSCIVAREPPDESRGGRAVLSGLIRVLMDGDFHLVLALQLGDKIMRKFRRLEELDQLCVASKHQLMFVWDHAEELVDAMRHLPLRTSNSDLVTRLLSAGEIDFAVVLLLELVNLRKSSNQLTMVQPINIDDLRRIFGILMQGLMSVNKKSRVEGFQARTYSSVNHFENLVLNSIKILGIACRSTANNIVDFDVIVLATHSPCSVIVSHLLIRSCKGKGFFSRTAALLTSVHSIGELDKDRVLLHDALNVLTANTNNALMVLVGDMERD